MQQSQPMQSGSDHTTWDRKGNQVDLNGHAFVRQTGELLTADFIHMNLNTRMLDAFGHCVYLASDTIINADEMHFNLDTRTGSIINGRISTDRFTLAGEKLVKLGDGRYQTYQGEYTTCRDCPQSWAFQGQNVDMEFEGYAYMSNVTAKVNDVPVTWLPYLIVPLKTHRQTGLLFPRFRLGGADGFTFVQPFFWAINRSSDLTVAAGNYSKRGLRLEGEGRYALTDRSGGQIQYYRVNDRTFQYEHNRWALDVRQTQELPFGIDEKLQFFDMSDNHYPIDFPGDVPGLGEKTVASTLLFSHSTDKVTTFLAARRYRNLLLNDPDPANAQVLFDPNTVQIYPTFEMTTNDKVFSDFLPVVGGLTLGMTNFTRTGGAFDYDYFTNPGPVPPTRPFIPGTDPIRKATRFSATPRLYMTLRPWDVLSLVPSVEYRGYFYSFHNEIPNLSRGYLLVQADLATQLERVFDTGNPDVPKTKHLIRPILTYSLIPIVNEPQVDAAHPLHPFLQQIQNAQNQGFTGYNFDDNDIVPRDTSPTYNNYFVPLGNSLSYGLTTQYIRRRGRLDSPSPVYQRAVELSAGQTINFREFSQHPDAPQPLSRFFTYLNLDLDHFSSATQYYYYPYAPMGPTNNRNTISTSFSYIFERGMHQRILSFDRSFSMGYTYNKLPGSATKNLTAGVTYSISDYFMPSFSISYQLPANPGDSPQLLSADARLQFQSPSQCYSLSLDISKDLNHAEVNLAPNFSLNLTGSGFGGVGDLTSKAGI